MMQHDMLRQLTHDRCERLLRESEARRLALQVRRQHPRRRTRRMLRARRQLAA
jgi:hypothetical protein